MIRPAYAYTIGSPTDFESFGELFGTLLPNIFIAAGLLMFFYLLYGGFRYLTAGGDEKAVTAAKQTLTNAVVGLIIIFTSYWIVWIIQTVLGIDIGVG